MQIKWVLLILVYLAIGMLVGFLIIEWQLDGWPFGPLPTRAY